MNAYEQGIKAYKNGVDYFQNPHVYLQSSHNDFTAWCCGWMVAKYFDKFGDTKPTASGEMLGRKK